MSLLNNIKRVAVIGGGVAGLQVVNRLSALGLKCTMYEKEPDVGGVWRDNYADFGLQVPYELYEFPGYKFDTNEKFPKGPLV